MSDLKNTQNKVQQNYIPKSTNKSLRRLLRQLFFLPFLHQHWLNQHFKQQLSQQITLAEANTSGEIYCVIENTLPITQAYQQTPRMRAIELFAKEHVWDTEDNTGVLVYVNVCEHDLEIIADRGIAKFICQTTWDELCANAIEGIKQGNHLNALSHLIQQIGALLKEYHKVTEDKSGNELSDTIKHIQ